MPNDLLGIKKCYPDSGMGYKFFHYVRDLKKNVQLNTNITETTIPNWFRFEDASVGDMKVIALGSEALPAGNTENHQIAIQQKFLSTLNDYKNVEASWYVQYQSGTDPWCIYTRSGSRRDHRKPCLGASYRAYLRPDGKVRLAKETYFGNRSYYPAKDWAQGISAFSVDQIVGMKLVCFNIEEDAAVKLELWIDEFNNNDWKPALSFTDTGNNWGFGATRCGCANDRQPITWGGPVVGFTSEGNSPSNTNYSFTNTTVREINGGGVFAEATAGSTTATAIAGGGQAMASINGQATGSNTGGGVGDGGGGAGDDLTTGTGFTNINEPLFTIQPVGSIVPTGLPFPFPPQVGTGGSTSSPIGSPSSGTDATPTNGTNQKPERPLVTVYKDLGLLYNIVLDNSSACDVGSPFDIDYRQIYSASGVDTQEIKLFVASGGIVRTGAKAHSSASVLVGKIIRKVTVTLRKFGNPTTGDLIMEIRDKFGVLMHTFDTIIDPATVATGAFGPTYEFLSNGNTHRCQAGDMLLLVYSDNPGTTDTNASNCLIMKSTDKDELDGFDTVQVSQSHNSTTYNVSQDKDMVGTIFI